MTADSVSSIRNASLDVQGVVPVEGIVALLRQGSGEADIEVSDVRAPSSTGVSSGGLFLTARMGARPPLPLFLKYDSQGSVRPFHQYDLAAQFETQRALRDAGVPTPNALYLDAGGAFLTKPGFIMEAVSGEPGSSKAWSEGALATADPQDRSAMIEDAIEQMGKMHAIDINQPGLASLHRRAAGSTSLEREVNWTLDLAKFHDFEDPRINDAANALLNRQPVGYRDVFLHGDNKFDNYLFEGRHVSAVIDFEMTTVGPPELDLAYLLFTTAKLSPPDAPRPSWFPNAEQLLQRYAQLTGHEAANWSYYCDLIAFKFSVMILAFTTRLGVAQQMPEAFATYWQQLEAVAGSRKLEEDTWYR